MPPARLVLNPELLKPTLRLVVPVRLRSLPPRPD